MYSKHPSNINAYESWRHQIVLVLPQADDYEERSSSPVILPTEWQNSKSKFFASPTEPETSAKIVKENSLMAKYGKTKTLNEFKVVSKKRNKRKDLDNKKDNRGNQEKN